MKKFLSIAILLIFVASVFYGCSAVNASSDNDNEEEDEFSQSESVFEKPKNYDITADGVVETDEENPNTDYYLSNITYKYGSFDYTENGQAKRELFELMGDCYTEYEFDENELMKTAKVTLYTNASADGSINLGNLSFEYEKSADNYVGTARGKKVKFSGEGVNGVCSANIDLTYNANGQLIRKEFRIDCSVNADNEEESFSRSMIFEYGYDCYGNMVEFTESMYYDKELMENNKYEYSSKYELISEASADGHINAMKHCYEYDDVSGCVSKSYDIDGNDTTPHNECTYTWSKRTK